MKPGKLHATRLNYATVPFIFVSCSDTPLPLSTVFSTRSRQNKRENNLWTVTNIFTGLHISPLSTLIVIACSKIVSPVSSFLLYEECNFQTFRETKTVFLIYFKHFRNTTY